MLKPYSDEVIEKIALAHFQKNHHCSDIRYITRTDIMDNFSNSFKFILDHPRFQS